MKIMNLNTENLLLFFQAYFFLFVELIFKDVEKVVEKEPITGQAARQAYLQLRQYFEENALSENLYSAFDHIEDLLLKDQKAKLKQPTIHHFFTRQ